MEELVKLLKDRNETISFMESCTGGFLASKFTNIPSASDVLKVSLTTYSNEYKIKFGINPETINKYTVYSKEVAEEMAKQVSKFSNSDWGIGITGKLEIEAQEDNRVYYSIYNKKGNTFITNKIIVQAKDRESMKEKILLDILNNFPYSLYC